MEAIARVYGDSLFEVAKEEGKLDEIREQLAQFTEALNSSHDLRVFLFSPYFSSAEKREGLGKALSGGDEEFLNFLALLAEKHRMPAIFRIRDHFDELYSHEHRRLDVTLTSAVELDKGVVKRVQDEIERQTDRKLDMVTDVDPEVLGGLVLRVGNMVLDASIRTKLEKLRKEVARAA